MAVSSTVLITRVEQEAFESVSKILPEVEYNNLAKVMVIDRERYRSAVSGIVIVAAGTSDLSVAEEASITAELMGNKVERIWDVGVAGVHRLLENLPILNKARVVVAVAGMEGALPSLVAGLVSAPVIAVPTSVGYGANFHGMAALLAMLNACSPGIAVVNIDNGFGAGYMAAVINLLGSKTPTG
jgi:NCAIR mutase (PurE)-related protein